MHFQTSGYLPALRDRIYRPICGSHGAPFAYKTANPLAGLRTGDNSLFEGRDLIGEKAMNPMPFAIVGLSLFINPALAQTQLPPPTSVPPATESAAKAEFVFLPGRRIRLQGGVVITIDSLAS